MICDVYSLDKQEDQLKAYLAAMTLDKTLNVSVHVYDKKVQILNGQVHITEGDKKLATLWIDVNGVVQGHVADELNNPIPDLLKQAITALIPFHDLRGSLYYE
jgi:hypothetical protein